VGRKFEARINGFFCGELTKKKHHQHGCGAQEFWGERKELSVSLDRTPLLRDLLGENRRGSTVKRGKRRFEKSTSFVGTGKAFSGPHGQPSKGKRDVSFVSAGAQRRRRVRKFFERGKKKKSRDGTFWGVVNNYEGGCF